MAKYEAPQKPTVVHADEREHRRIIAQYARTCLHRSGAEAFVGLRGEAYTPDALTGNVNNWDLGDYTIARLSCDTNPYAVTGIVSSGRPGALLMLVNVGSPNLTLNNQDASSDAENRIITGTGGNVSLAQDEHIILWYDTTDSRWRALG